MIRVALIGNVRRILREGLEPDEKRDVDDWVDSLRLLTASDKDKHRHDGHLYTDRVMGNKQRIKFPMKDHGNEVESDIKGDVERHLGHHGYEVSDYKAGLAKQRGGNRQIKIGKLLGKEGKAEDENLASQFTNDEARDDRKHDYSKDHSITISRHPHDVAGMSACSHPWDSCLNFKSGSENKHLPHEVKQGTLVAYMHHNDDPKMNNPVSRIAIRPWISEEGHRIYRAEGAVGVYGKKAAGNFHKSVTDWANHNFPAKPGHLYRRQETVYNEVPGPQGKHLHGDIDIHNMSDDKMTDYVARRRNSKIPDHHYDHIVANGSEDAVARLTRQGGVHMEDLKRNLDVLAKKHPDLYFSSGVFRRGRDAHHLIDDNGKPEVRTGAELITNHPAEHVEQAIPGISDHIKTLANSVGPKAHHAHEFLARCLKSKLPYPIINKHRDDIHQGVLRKPTLGMFNSDKVEKHLDNVESCFETKRSKSVMSKPESAMSKHVFDKAMESADKLSQSFKPGRGSNWVHHVMNAHRAAPGSLSAESGAAMAARNVVSTIKDNPHYDEARHGHIVNALEGK